MKSFLLWSGGCECAHCRDRYERACEELRRAYVKRAHKLMETPDIEMCKCTLLPEVANGQ